MCAAHSTFEVRERALLALRRGMPISEVAKAYSTDRTTVYRWKKRFEIDGQTGLLRRPGSGRPAILQSIGGDDIAHLVKSPATDFGYETNLWTVRRIQAVIGDQHGVNVSKQTIWRRLRAAGLTYQKPERAYREIDEEARLAWVSKEAPKILQAVKKYRAILYFQDESNVSLTAFLGKTWAPRGETPKVTVTGKRGGVAAMSAISRQGHLLFRLHDKRIASQEVIDFLQQMLKHHKHRHLVVVMDQAPPHTSQKTKVFIDSQPRLHVFYLPKYSPDWNPDEKVWNHLKHQELKSHQAKTKEELKRLAHNKLRKMSRNSSLMRGIFFRCCIADLFEH